MMSRRFVFVLACCLVCAGSLHAQITVNTIHVTPAFRHILVSAYISPGTTTQASLAVTYRVQGAPAWVTAHAGMRSTNDPYWLSTVIFGLTESTPYEVHAVITDPSGVTNGDQTFTVTTRSTAAPAGSGATYHVSPAGSDSTGDGSAGNPWKSLTHADTVAAPGDTVLAHGGTYTAQQSLSHSGSLAGGYVVYEAATGETPVFDGSDPTYTTPNSGNRFAPVAGRPGVFSATPGYEPVYVAAAAERLYNYANDENVPLDSLTTGAVTHNGTSYAVPGWLYQGGTLYVHLAGGVDPDTVAMHLTQAGSRIQINNADYVALRGLTVRYTDYGIRVRGDHTATALQPAGRFAWIDSNTLDHIGSTGILTTGWTSCSGTVSNDASIGAPGTVLIRNNIQDAANTTDWPWNIKKGTDAENDAINLKAGDGAIVRENTMHDVFNGVGASNWGDCFWGGFPLESAGMNRNAVIELNTITDIGDDVTEPEGAIINFVMQENKGLRVHTGISVAPIGEGPVWVVRNEIIDYVESCLKFWDGLTLDRGWILVYHNTFYTSLPGGAALLVYPDSANDVKVKMRNNIFVGDGMAVDAGDPHWGTNVSIDYDAFYSISGAVPAVMWYYPATVTCGGGGTNDHCWYDSVGEWIADTLVVGYPQEQNGLDADPMFLNATGHDLRLSEGSPLIDQGVVLAGINDDYLGSAPDRGAHEYDGATSSFLFFDDFEDGDASDWTHTKGAWPVSAGELTGITTKKADDLAPFAGCTPCTVETFMNVDAGTKASLLAWYADKKTLIELMMNEPGDRWILKQKSAGVTVLKRVCKQPIVPNTDYKVTVSYDGATFQVLVDDVVIITAPAGASAAGNVGFRVKSATGSNVTARFEQIAVW